MFTLLGSVLAAIVLAQTPNDLTIAGAVVDETGKPLGDVPVVYYAAPVVSGREDQAEAQTRTDAGGQFRIKVPAYRRMAISGISVLAYRNGSAITANSFLRRPYRLVLRKPEARTIQIEGPDGQSIARARIAPRIIQVFNGDNADIPGSLADPLAVTTGPDGRATLEYLAAQDQLVAVRVSADLIGTQDVLLVERPGRSSVEPVIKIKLKRTSRLAGRILDGAFQPASGQVVEIWSRGRGAWLRPNSVELRGGPLLTTADGRFQTPDNLMIGSTYRVVVRGPGKDTILSDWITIGDTPRALLPMRLRSLRTVSGRVVDRQGKAIGNVEIFQSGDGPEQTATRSDADGRFVLDGFREGPVFVFAHGDGFRFHGQLIREGEHDVKVELTRGSEPPLREMRMLAEPVPLEESRAMARRLVEPVWKVVLEKGNDRTKADVLLAIVNADPRGVLEKLESAKFVNRGLEFRIQAAVAAALAETDVEEASAVAESIEDPAERAGSLMAVVDALPAAQRPKKLALLDRALVHARAAIEPAQRLRRIGDGAERLYELGEIERAKVVFAEGLQLANQMKVENVYPRAYFAAQLARVDPPATLAIAKELKGARPGGSFRVDLGLRMMDQDPAEALWFWQETHGVRGVGIRAILGKLPMGDPARAKGFFEKLQLTHSTGLRADFYAFMALGLKASDEPGSRGALEEVVRAVDELLRERPEQLHEPLNDLLPVVERIDPGVVPEIFWRYVASRPGYVNPRAIRNDSPSVLIRQLARYDGEVAAALFETIRTRMERTDDRDLAAWLSEFEAWSSFDPRGAVARLERLPVGPDPSSSDPRLRVASLLGLSQRERLRRIWPD